MMYQARFCVGSDMRFHAEEVLVVLMRWSAQFEKPGESRLTGFLS
jgi:hypothetical protein